MAVARTKGVDPLDLPPLGDVVDPDALDALFHDPDDVDGEVWFEYAGTTVVVDSDGGVTVQPDVPE